MRYLVISDIHGGFEPLKQVLEYFNQYQCDLIISLGDILNHGPRNAVPTSYNPSEVSKLLNTYASKIIAVRGNCDSEVDSALLNFPCNSPYSYIFVPNLTNPQQYQKIMLTHGHLYQLDSATQNATESTELMTKLGLKANDLVLSGHTHLPGIYPKQNGLVNINPGSITIPRGQDPASFGLILENEIQVRSLDNQLLYQYSFKFN